MQAQEADQEDREVYVGARTGKADKKKKKSTRRGGGSGGYDSGNRSDDSARGRRKSYASDESDGAQKRKKEGLTRDYLETVRKTPLLASPRELMTAFARTPGMGRIPMHPTYPYMPTPGAYGLAPASFPSQVVMRERPTIDKLCLSKLDVPYLFSERSSSDWRIQTIRRSYC